VDSSNDAHVASNTLTVYQDACKLFVEAVARLHRQCTRCELTHLRKWTPRCDKIKKDGLKRITMQQDLGEPCAVLDAAVTQGLATNVAA
jgi:hypothetical protein